MLGWIYFALMVFGGGLLLMGTIGSDVGDEIEGLVDGLDQALEGIGIDVIPDNPVEDEGVFTLRTAAAFVALFGAGGLITFAFFHVSVGASVIWAILSGVAGGLVVWKMMQLLKRQQASSSIMETDYIGVSGVVSSGAPRGKLGQGTFTVKGVVSRTTIRERDGQALPMGSTVQIIAKEGTVCTVVRK